METQQNDDLELSRVLLLLKRRLWVVLLAGAVAAVAAFVYSTSQPKLYRATAEINAVDQTAGVFRNSGDPNPQRDVNNALFLLQSRAVREPAMEQLGSSAPLVDGISAETDRDTWPDDLPRLLRVRVATGACAGFGAGGGRGHGADHRHCQLN